MNGHSVTSGKQYQNPSRTAFHTPKNLNEQQKSAIYRTQNRIKTDYFGQDSSYRGPRDALHTFAVRLAAGKEREGDCGQTAAAEGQIVAPWRSVPRRAGQTAKFPFINNLKRDTKINTVNSENFAYQTLQI